MATVTNNHEAVDLLARRTNASERVRVVQPELSSDDEDVVTDDARRSRLFEALFPLVQTPPKRQPERRDNIVSCFFPGITASRAQGAKYAGPDGVPVLDHDGDKVAYHAVCACAPRLLHNVLPMPELHDVGHGWDLNPVHWVSKGLDLMRNTALRIRGATLGHVQLTRVNIGGDVDQQECRRMIERAVAQRAGRHVVIFGTSRGAATVFSTVLKLEEPLASAISLVVVEAPFDTVDHVVRKTSFFPAITLKVLSTIGTYRGEEHDTPEHAIMSTATVALKAPIAFVTSERDRRVPPEHTLRLMKLLQERHPSVTVHHLALKKSHHSAMSIHHEADRDAYVDFMESLYNRYCPAT